MKQQEKLNSPITSSLSTMYLPRLDSSTNPTSSSSMTQKRMMLQKYETESKLRRLDDVVEEGNATQESNVDPKSEAGLGLRTTQPKVEQEETPRLSAKSQLYTLCSMRHWKAPIYECFAEGPSHKMLFTAKVMVEVKEDAKITVLECFGNPQHKKKLAAEQAAEAALWYLKNVGHTV